MNIIKYVLATLSLLFVLGACTEDKKLIYDPNNVSPGQLANINASYVLDATNAAGVAQVFNWGAFDMGYSATVTYALEMDIAGNNFANAIDLTSGNALSASITVGQLNAVMIKLQQIYGFADNTAQNVEFRVKGSISPNVDPFFTNVISTQITPYAADVEYAKVYVIGDFNAWNHANDQFLWAFTGGADYEGWIGFGGKAQSGFKLTGIPAWDSNSGNWGAASADGQTAEAASMNLINGDASQNITAYSKNFYKFKYNTSSLTLSVEYSINSLSIVGDATGDPNWTTDIPFTFDTQTQQFVAITTLQDGNIKFRGDNTWGAVNLGLPADAAAFAPKGTLINGNDSKNIPVTAGTYKITLNLNNSDDMTYLFESMAALDPSKITPQVLTHGDLAMSQNKSDNITWTALDFGGQTPTTVNYTVEMALKGTSFANAQTLGTTTATSLTVSGDAYLAALKALDSSIGLDQATDVDMRVTATVQGLTNTFTSNVATFNLNIQTPPQFPDELYMTGDEFGSWFSDQSGVVKMIPVNGIAGSFWCIKYFHAGNGFKWAPQPAWSGGDFGADGSLSGGYTISGNNASVDADGLYMVYIDMSANAITIEPAKVYGIGDCFGSWDVGAYPFTVSGSTASITTTAAGDVRMYAGTSAPTAITADWWRMEFIIQNGQIAYRGNGGDQDRVSVNAGQTVTLDFSTDTGTIQ